MSPASQGKDLTTHEKTLRKKQRRRKIDAPQLVGKMPEGMKKKKKQQVWVRQIGLEGGQEEL